METPMDGTVGFAVLGPMEIRRGETGEAVTGRLRRTLLGVLLARPGGGVPADTLSDALWGERPDERAAARLQLHIHRLRAFLGDPDRLAFGVDGYRLRVAPGELDADRFETLIAEALRVRAREPGRAAVLLREALELWRGVPFAGLEVPLLDDWAHRLGERRLTAYEALYEAELACGNETAAVDGLSALVREHPLRERLHALLMTALYRAGRPADALAVYRTARERLVAELGLEPGPELRALERSVLAGEPIGRAARPGPSGAPAPPVPRTPAQLPADVTRFTGREAELAELDALLARPGNSGPVLVTAVAGTAGVGKTALAVRWAHRVRDRFPDGQLYVDLHGYGPDRPVAPEDALAGFLRALGVDGGSIPPEPAERAARYRTLLDGRRVLVVLDNAHSAEQVRPLLPGSPTACAVITSRDALAGLVAREGAHRLTLDRLPPADARSLLRQLLGARATAAPAAVDALIERCARLPLALRITAELARSQPSRPLADLAAELADRHEALELLDLDGDPYTAVRAVFSWSYQRLDPGVARVFRLFGVLPGHDTDAHTLAAMAGTGPRSARHALETLLRAHLVDRIAPGRYQPHDLLRAYAAELAADPGHTAERATALTRLSRYYRAASAAALDAVAPYEKARRPAAPAWDGELPALASPEAARRWLDTERAGLLEATRHGPPELTRFLSDTLWRYLETGGYHDDSVTLHERALVLARESGDRLAEANALRQLSTALNRSGGDLHRAIALLRQALVRYEELGEPELRDASLVNLGNAYASLGDHFEALRQYRLAQEGGAGGWVLHRAALCNSGISLQLLGRYEEAAQAMRTALALCQEHGDRTNEGNILSGLAEVSLQLGEEDRAYEEARRALGLARETGYRLVESHALRVLGQLHERRAEPERALHHHIRAEAIAREVGDPGLIASALNSLAGARAVAGHPRQALREYAESIAVAVGSDHRDLLARAHAGIAEVHAGLGDRVSARAHWRQALTHCEALGLPETDRVRERLAQCGPEPATA
ncbi:AfsR/SARP family transcriptional regulator [Streptomyces carpaticus]